MALTAGTSLALVKGKARNNLLARQTTGCSPFSTAVSQPDGTASFLYDVVMIVRGETIVLTFVDDCWVEIAAFVVPASGSLPSIAAQPGIVDYRTTTTAADEPTSTEAVETPTEEIRSGTTDVDVTTTEAVATPEAAATTTEAETKATSTSTKVTISATETLTFRFNPVAIEASQSVCNETAGVQSFQVIAQASYGNFVLGMSALATTETTSIVPQMGFTCSERGGVMLGVAGSNNFSSPRKINAYVEPMNQVNFTHYVFTKYVFANFSGDTAHRTFQTNVTGPDGKSVVVNHNATGSAGAAVPFFEPQPHALPGREIVFTFPDPCAPATSWDSCSKYFYSMTSFEIVPIQAIP